MHKVAALWHTSARSSLLQQAVVQAADDRVCLIRSLYSLVSTGTEKLVATGQVPATLYHDMQVPYMEGSFDFPLKYGYSLVGRVEEGPAALLGKTVHLLHPHQEACYVRAEDLFVVPHTVPPLRATLASNLETALNAVWDSQVSIGDRVLITGFGLIGSLLARLLQKIAAVEVCILDTNPLRQQQAQDMGFRLAADTPSDFDLAFHTSGSSAGLQSCIDKAGYEGKIIELSWYGRQPVSLQLGGTFHSRRKQIISSQVSQLPAQRRPRWDYGRRKATVFELLQDAAFDAHITQTVAFADLPSFFANLREGQLPALGCSVSYLPTA